MGDWRWVFHGIARGCGGSGEEADPVVSGFEGIGRYNIVVVPGQGGCRVKLFPMFGSPVL